MKAKELAELLMLDPEKEMHKMTKQSSKLANHELIHGLYLWCQMFEVIIQGEAVDCNPAIALLMNKISQQNYDVYNKVSNYFEEIERNTPQ